MVVIYSFTISKSFFTQTKASHLKSSLLYDIIYYKCYFLMQGYPSKFRATEGTCF